MNLLHEALAREHMRQRLLDAERARLAAGVDRNRLHLRVRPHRLGAVLARRAHRAVPATAGR